MPFAITAAVLDASALIVIAKLEALDDWKDLYGRLVVPGAVEQECVGDDAYQDRPDVQLIRNALAANKLERASLSRPQLKQAQEWHEQNQLGLGECQVLAYVRVVLNTIALVEDRRARSFARQNQIPYTLLQLSPMEGYIRKRLSYARATRLTAQVALLMHSDLAVLNTLQLALNALALERGDIHDTSQD